MTKPAAPKMQAGRRNVASILKQVARAVAYITLALGIGATVTSCQEWHRAHAINCSAPGVVCDI